MASPGRRAAREQEMHALLRKWERSGLPLSRYAEHEGIGRKTLYRWRQRIGVGASDLRRARRAKRAATGRRSEPAVARFLEVSSARRRAWPSMEAMFEVVLSRGTVVRVGEHFDTGALRALIETLREC